MKADKVNVLELDNVTAFTPEGDYEPATKKFVEDAVAAGGGGGSSSQIDCSGGTSDTYGVLSGSINGSNTTFTVSEGAYVSGSLKVWLNGQLQTQGSSEDWVETTPASGTFDFNTAPLSGDIVVVEYIIP